VGVLWWGIFTALTTAVSSKIAFAFVYLVACAFSSEPEKPQFSRRHQFRVAMDSHAGTGIAWLIFAGVGRRAGVTQSLSLTSMV